MSNFSFPWLSRPEPSRQTGTSANSSKARLGWNPYEAMTHDVLIIGSGLAGMSAAIRLAESHKVALVTKLELLVGASSWAQGGIAAVLDSGDSLDDHVRDTHIAGAGLCHDDAVRFVVERGRQSVEWLVAQGVPFTRDDDNQAELHLTREGGHSHRRIAHAADATGSAVQKTLVERVKSHPNIEVFEWHVAIDLITGRKLRGPQLVGAGVEHEPDGDRVWGA